MLKIPTSTLYTRDSIQEGDIAVISYDGNQEIVYFFRTDIHRLSMVSLSQKSFYWEDINKHTFKVLKIFQPGETLEVM